MIKAILWDNDGVLVDTESLYYTATRQILLPYGVDLTKEMYNEFFLIQGRGAWHLLEEKGLSTDQLQKLKNERNELYHEKLLKESISIDGVKETLDYLSVHFKMGIVTSSRKDHFDRIHKASGLLKYFNFILTAEDYKKFKPDPEPYLLAVEKSGFSKEECVAIEDSERGLKSAKSAGIKCFIIPNELSKTSDFSLADKVLNNIRQVIEVLS